MVWRPNPMRRSLFVLVLLAATPVFAQQPPEIRYHSVPDFLRLPPDIHLGEATGVAVNSKGHIFVFTRGNTTGPAYGASAAQLLEFTRDGKFLREIGHHLYAWSFAHTVKVDRDDNIWATDKGSDMVIKFNPEGRVVMVFGRKQEDHNDTAFGIELNDHVGAFVGSPNVVVPDDLDGVGEGPGVEMVANLAEEFSVARELEELRSARAIGGTGGIAAREDEDVAFGIDGDAGGFTEMD